MNKHLKTAGVCLLVMAVVFRVPAVEGIVTGKPKAA